MYSNVFRCTLLCCWSTCTPTRTPVVLQWYSAKRKRGAEVAAHVRQYKVKDLERERKAKAAAKKKAEKKTAANELKKAAPATADKRSRRRR